MSGSFYSRNEWKQINEPIYYLIAPNYDLIVQLVATTKKYRKQWKLLFQRELWENFRSTVNSTVMRILINFQKTILASIFFVLFNHPELFELRIERTWLKFLLASTRHAKEKRRVKGKCLSKTKGNIICINW